MRTGKDVDQQKCSDRLGASNLKKTPPQRPDTAAAADDDEGWSVMTSCKETSDWRV